MFFFLQPVSACGCNPGAFAPSSSSSVPSFNAPMSYDSNLGTPTAQNIVPPFPALPASIYDVNGTANGYGWNPNTGAWV